MRKIELMLAGEAITLCAERVIPATHAFLPLGGDAFTQLATFLVAGLVWEKLTDKP